jgi:hypothetical protein
MQGYTIRVAEAIKEADGSLLGVQLGRACLARDIPVSAVAERLKVTRQTVYHWFLGLSEPRGGARDAIQTYLASIK